MYPWSIWFWILWWCYWRKFKHFSILNFDCAIVCECCTVIDNLSGVVCIIVSLPIIFGTAQWLSLNGAVCENTLPDDDSWWMTIALLGLFVKCPMNACLSWWTWLSNDSWGRLACRIKWFFFFFFLIVNLSGGLELVILFVSLVVSTIL